MQHFQPSEVKITGCGLTVGVEVLGETSTVIDFEEDTSEFGQAVGTKDAGVFVPQLERVVVPVDPKDPEGEQMVQEQFATAEVMRATGALCTLTCATCNKLPSDPNESIVSVDLNMPKHLEGDAAKRDLEASIGVQMIDTLGLRTLTAYCTDGTPPPQQPGFVFFRFRSGEAPQE